MRELARLAPLYRTPQAEPWTEQTIDLVRAFQRLPTRMRVCAALFYGDDMTVQQIADAVGISPKTVENQLRNARTRLRSWLAFDEGERNEHELV